LTTCFRFKRLADPQISPDGTWVVYAAGTVDMDANRVIYNLWLASTEKPGLRTQLTRRQEERPPPALEPRRQVDPVSNRRAPATANSGSSTSAAARPGSSPTVSTGAGTALWVARRQAGRVRLAVWPEFSTKLYTESDALNRKRMDERETNPVKARVFTRLFFRHWDEWVEDKRQHLFVASFAGGKLGEPRDVTPGDRDAYPTSHDLFDRRRFSRSAPTASTSTSPPCRRRTRRGAPTTTSAGSPSPAAPTSGRGLTAKNPAADGAPQFSPDGKWLAYRAQKRPGYEADRWDLFIPDGRTANGKAPPRNITPEFDGSVDAFTWLPDSERSTSRPRTGAKTWYYSTSNQDRRHAHHLHQRARQQFAVGQQRRQAHGHGRARR